MAYRVFIGSSQEHLEYAEEVQRNLEKARIPELEPICWPTIFTLGSYVLESLLKALKQSTFGIFILAPDDYIAIRDEIYQIPRDNVILEMGMFIAGVGRENTFFIHPQNTDENNFHLPSDLDGVVGASYLAHLYGDNIAAKINGACTDIKRAIREKIRKQKEIVEGSSSKIESPEIPSKKSFTERLKEYQKDI